MKFNKLYEDIFKPASPEEVIKRQGGGQDNIVYWLKNNKVKINKVENYEALRQYQKDTSWNISHREFVLGELSYYIIQLTNSVKDQNNLNLDKILLTTNINGDHKFYDKTSKEIPKDISDKIMKIIKDDE